MQDGAGPEIPVVAEGLCKSFRRQFWQRPVEVVHDVSFTVGRSEVLGLLGRNGSGKTTTLALLLGLLHPTAGASRLLGVDPSRREVRRQLGFLPEEGGVEPLATARETLRLRAATQGLPRDVVDEGLAFFGIVGFADRLIRRLSKGMRRRIALAQAALGWPRLLFLDEPTSGLDPDGVELVHRTVERTRAGGGSVVLTSHVRAGGLDLCDRLVVLEGGCVVTSGSAAELRDDPERYDVRCRGLDPERLRALAREAGGDVESITPVRRDLRELLDRVAGAGARSSAETPRRPPSDRG